MSQSAAVFSGLYRERKMESVQMHGETTIRADTPPKIQDANRFMTLRFAFTVRGGREDHREGSLEICAFCLKIYSGIQKWYTD